MRGEVQPVGQIPGWQVEHTKDARLVTVSASESKSLSLQENREGFGTLAKHGIDARGVRSPRQQIARADSGAQPVFHQAAPSAAKACNLRALWAAKQGARFLHVWF
jgi:hypothetical protein